MTILISGGSVSVEDAVKHAGYPDPQYAPTRKVRVELIFAVPEGADASPELHAAGDKANAEVARLLGIKLHALPASTATAAVSTAAADAAKAAYAAGAAATPAKPPKAPGARKKAETPAAPPSPATPQTAAADVVEEPETVTGDEFASPATEAVTAITDEDLHSAMTRKNGELKNPVPIRQLVGAFKPAGHTGQFTAQQIPQEQRAAFLAKLDTLKA